MKGEEKNRAGPNYSRVGTKVPESAAVHDVAKLDDE